MRFKTGLMIGFGAGYYFGARAGRERYEQLNEWLDKIRSTPTYETATEKAKAAVDLGVERAKDLVGTNGESGEPADVVTRNQTLAEGPPAGL
jgi:hypothetical protein